MKIQYLEAMFGFTPEHQHIAVPAESEEKLKQMAAHLVGTDDLIAIYVPETTLEVYEPGDLRGKVAGAVNLLAMPSGRSVRDYYYDDWDQTRRWPVGWPCQVVFAPPLEQAPELRGLVELLFGPGNFRTYAAQLRHGPIPISGRMAEELLRRFSAGAAVTG